MTPYQLTDAFRSEYLSKNLNERRVRKKGDEVFLQHENLFFLLPLSLFPQVEKKTCHIKQQKGF